MGRYRKDRPSTGPKHDDGRQNDDDKTLWEKVTQSVTALPSRKERLFADVPSVPAVQNTSASASEDKKNPVQGQRDVSLRSQKSVTPPADLRLGEHSGIDRSNARRLQRGQMHIEDKLDLHGLSQDQAHRNLISFISRAVHQNLRHVLVITGKGRDGQGVLRQQVPKWLKDAPLAPHINAISHAQPQDGGTGALYIRLKRKRGDVR